MHNFVLVTNIYKDKELRLSREIVSYIEKKGGTAKICISSIRGDEGRNFKLSEIPEDTDCILVLGGDGTLIRAATKVESLQIPLIGINLGTLGYLCELEEHSVFDAVDHLMAGAYIIEKRMMLSGFKQEESEPKLALNDVVIHWAGDLSMLQLLVYVNGKYLTTYHADGLVVATPTGSTGYNMSAGGPIVEPDAQMILITPINAHDLNSQSIVLNARDLVEIEMGSRRYQENEKAGVSFDGDTALYLRAGEKVKIALAKHVVQICKISNESFLEILQKKMKSNAP